MLRLALRRLHARRPARTRCCARPRDTGDDPRGRARLCSRRPRPLIEQRGLTLVGVALANLDDDGVVQLALPFDKAATGPLDAALDDVRDRFGSTAVTRAVLLGRDPGL